MDIKMYKKEIIYMSLYDNDVKEGCVGYLKSEERQGKFRLELQIKNIPWALSGNYPIRLQSTMGWHEDGVLMLKEGSGIWTGNADEPIIRVEIVLSEPYKIKGQSKNTPVNEELDTERQGTAESVENGARQQGIAESEENGVRQQSTVKSEENDAIQQAVVESWESERREKGMAESPERELRQRYTIESADSAPVQRVTAESSENELRRQAEVKVTERKSERQVMTESTPLYESKWEQLLATYERIHPYGDSRVYVKLEPKDFVILPSGYQHLVNNSFLLHGFYNYRYLILGKEKDFYLGVPGVFYEREKMVALMFGFEAFECEGGNAEEGKFGYYLRKVEL